MMELKNILVSGIFTLIMISIFQEKTLAQCTNTTQFPSNTLSAPIFNTPKVLTTESYAGQFIKLHGLVLNKTYQISSSNATDYLTIRDKDGITLLAHGTSPVNISVGAGPDIITIHINPLTPPCGSENTYRTITATCTDCPPEPPKVGISTITPEAILDVNGKIKIGDDSAEAKAGMVRWNSANSDFEGYNGTKWLSLTKSNAKWGELPTIESNESAMLTASDGTGSDNFGLSVAISGDYAIIGAYNDDIGINTDQGSAYIFVRSGTTWTQQAKLIASDGYSNDYFGLSVSISGDYALIGAYRQTVGVNYQQGSAYVFVRSGSTWTQQAKLTANDGAPNDYFGYSVSISGDYAVVGAYKDDAVYTDVGSSYVFFRSGTSWTQQSKLTASDGAAYDNFGYSVSISGDYVVIGALFDDIGVNSSQGSAYIFLRSGTFWTQQTKLTASDGAADDNLGYSIAISGDYVVISAIGDDVGTNTDQGSAYIFVRSGTSWAQQSKLTSYDGALGDYFGISVALSENYIVIGASRSEVGIKTDQGSAYIFVRSGTSWSQQVKLTASDGDIEDQFGIRVAISGDYVVIGSYHDNIGTNSDQGSTYLFIRQ